MDFTISTDHSMKIKEIKNIDKYFDLAWELKKMWIMKVTVIEIVVGSLGMNPKGTEKRQRKQTLEELTPYRPQFCWD